VKDPSKIIVTESIMFKNLLKAISRHDELNNMTVRTGSIALLITFFKIYSDSIFASGNSDRSAM
jgi:hypothetical protein